MKRMRDDEETKNSDLANCLLLLSNSSNGNLPHKSFSSDVVYECKTCNRQFSSFQALGGHRASHKRPRVGDELARSGGQVKFLSLGNKPKMHECSICGLEFSLGQALGGHMRRHRAASSISVTKEKELISSLHEVVAKVPVLKRSNSTRVSCLDLNLTPLENDLKLLFGKMAPKVDTYF